MAFEPTRCNARDATHAPATLDEGGAGARPPRAGLRRADAVAGESRRIRGRSPRRPARLRADARAGGPGADGDAARERAGGAALPAPGRGPGGSGSVPRRIPRRPAAAGASGGAPKAARRERTVRIRAGPGTRQIERLLASGSSAPGVRADGQRRPSRGTVVSPPARSLCPGSRHAVVLPAFAAGPFLAVMPGAGPLPAACRRLAPDPRRRLDSGNGVAAQAGYVPVNRPGASGRDVTDRERR